MYNTVKIPSPLLSNKETQHIGSWLINTSPSLQHVCDIDFEKSVSRSFKVCRELDSDLF